MFGGVRTLVSRWGGTQGRRRCRQWLSGQAAEKVAEENHVGFLTAMAGRGHPEKLGKHMHGEDAYFISSQENIFGVADGVSQWEDVNVDAGLYSRNLMASCHKEAIAMGENQGYVDPKIVLERGYRHSLSTVGSSTACIVSLDEDGTLHAANIGDSGFLVIRCGALREPPYVGKLHHIQPLPAHSIQWDLVYRSYEMQKFFNCPDQLGPACPDKPSRAEKYSLPVRPGDIVIAASDGLFDNISDTDICLIVKKLTPEVKDLFPEYNFESASFKADRNGKISTWLQNIADKLVDEAQVIGMSPTARTPFRRQCLRAGWQFEGGKLDDTIVVVGMVASKSSM